MNFGLSAGPLKIVVSARVKSPVGLTPFDNRSSLLPLAALTTPLKRKDNAYVLRHESQQSRIKPGIGIMRCGNGELGIKRVVLEGWSPSGYALVFMLICTGDIFVSTAGSRGRPQKG